MRVLIASTGGSGHFGPLEPFADALTARGDEVLFVVPPELEPRVRARRVPARRVRAGGVLGRLPRRARASEQALLGNREWFGRLCTAAMRPAMEAAFDDFAPELVLRDPCDFASAIAADARRVPYATIACSRGDVEWTSLDLIAPVLPDGIEAALRAAPYLTRFPASLDPPYFADTRRYREAEPARATGDGIYATFGSVAATRVGADPYRALLDAVDGLDRPVLLTPGADLDLGPIPPNVTVERWVPQAQALAAAALVVCHGGSGTVLGALAAGLPLVLTPMFSDQFPNAEAIAAAGAGVVTDGDGLRAAIEHVLATPAYREAAERIAGELRAAPDPLSAIP